MKAKETAKVLHGGEKNNKLMEQWSTFFFLLFLDREDRLNQQERTLILSLGERAAQKKNHF